MTTNTEAMASAADLDWLSRAPQLRGRHDIVIAAAAMIRQQAGEIERLTTETGRLKSMLDEKRADIAKIRKELIRVESTRCTAIDQLIIAQEDLRSQRAVNERLTNELAEANDEAARYQREAAEGDTEIVRLDARVRELEAADQWQPIESAPRDGTRVLLHFPHKGVREAFWASIHSDNPDDALWCVDDDKSGPYAIRGYRDGTDSAPTQWRPLPAPPAQQQENNS